MNKLNYKRLSTLAFNTSVMEAIKDLMTVIRWRLLTYDITYGKKFSRAREFNFAEGEM